MCRHDSLSKHCGRTHMRSRLYSTFEKVGSTRSKYYICFKHVKDNCPWKFHKDCINIGLCRAFKCMAAIFCHTVTICQVDLQMKWIGFLCTCRLNWAMISSWGWRDEWDDTGQHYPSDKAAQYWINIENKWAGKKHFVSLKLESQSGARARNLQLSKQVALTTAPGPRPSVR